MVRVQVGQQDDVDVFGRGADGAQVLRQLAERRLHGVTRAGVAQHQLAAGADQKRVHVEPDRLAGPDAGQPLAVGALDAEDRIEAAA